MKKDTAQRAIGRRETTHGLCFRPVGQPHVFIELTEISFGKTQEQPVCSRSHGVSSATIHGLEEFLNKETTKPSEDLNEDFYGSESFDTEEFDPEGFEISEGNPYH